MKNIELLLDPAYCKDSVFSWKGQVKRTRQAIVVMVFSVVFMSMLANILSFLNRGDSFGSRICSMSMPFLAMAVAIFVVTMIFMDFLVMKGWTQKHIQGWREYAAKVAHHKEIVLNRNLIIKEGHEALFKDVLYNDDEFLKKYDGSEHENELEVFTFAMEHAWPTMVGRFIALQMGYNYWAARMVPGIIK